MLIVGSKADLSALIGTVVMGKVRLVSGMSEPQPLFIVREVPLAEAFAYAEAKGRDPTKLLSCNFYEVYTD